MANRKKYGNQYRKYIHRLRYEFDIQKEGRPLGRIQEVLITRAFEIFTGKSDWKKLKGRGLRKVVHARVATVFIFREEFGWTYMDCARVLEINVDRVRHYGTKHDERWDKYEDYRQGCMRLFRYYDVLSDPDLARDIEFVYDKVDRLEDKLKQLEELYEARIETLENLIIK